jgi:hypothetical protein
MTDYPEPELRACAEQQSGWTCTLLAGPHPERKHWDQNAVQQPRSHGRPHQRQERLMTLPAYMTVTEYRTDDGRTSWAWRCWGDGDCDGWLHLDAGSEQYARKRASQHVTDCHPEADRSQP